MDLSSKEAFQILQNSRGMAEDDFWIDHSICVSNSASIISRALNLDDEYSKTLGYIHDIGKRFGFGSDHVVAGYEYILKLGYDEKYASICMTHSFLNNDINCVAGGLPNTKAEKYEFVKEYVKNHYYTIYDKIINLCDLLCKQRVMTLEQRLIEIISRRGGYENTKYHVNEAIKLKKDFDNILGYNLYELFPEIKDNL